MASDHARAEAERTGRALVELTRRAETRDPAAADLLDGVPPQRLVELACHHRVPGIVNRALVDLGVDDEAFASLGTVSRMAALGHQRSLVDLATTARVLAPLSRPWLVVKGPVLVEVSYGDAGSRLYEDIDVVVSGTEFAEALSLIEASGGRVPDVNWPLLKQLGRAELTVILPDGMPCDLHWHLLVTPRHRSRFTLPMDELLERRRTVAVQGIEVATLDVLDELLYLCLHGSTSGGGMLVWVKDIDQVLSRQTTEWDELIRRARSSGTDLVAAIQLERARSLLGAEVPLAVIDELAHDRLWWRWWRRNEQRAGMARWGGSEWADTDFVAATSGGSRASAVELWRARAEDASVHYRTGRPGRSRADGSGVPALYQPVGGDAARTAYLDAVGSGGLG